MSENQAESTVSKAEKLEGTFWCWFKIKTAEEMCIQNVGRFRNNYTYRPGAYMYRHGCNFSTKEVEAGEQ